MKTITIKIVKKSVMGVVEGLSATIAQHNPEVDFLTVWASDAEEAKLDIYYREAITDLENFLARFSSSTTQQFDLQALADDFTITIRTLAYWPPRLSGVLTNQIQNYLVHAIMAGWLSDFPDMPHTDYASMGASDLEAIKEVLLKKDFSFAEADRNADDAIKDKSSAMDAGTRKADNEGKGSSMQDVISRYSDNVGKDEAFTDATVRASDGTGKCDSSVYAGERAADEADKQENGLKSEGRMMDADTKEANGMDASNRSSDTLSKGSSGMKADGRNADGTEKSNNGVSVSVRKEDGSEKAEASAEAEARNKDNACQHFHHERVDWSGGRPPYRLR